MTFNYKSDARYLVLAHMPSAPKFVASAFLGFLAQCALPFYAFLSHSKDLEIFFTTFKIQANVEIHCDA